MKKTTILGISIAILGLVWAFVAAIYSFLTRSSAGWVGIACTAIAIVVAELYLLVFRKEPGKQGTEPGAIGIIFSICFLLIVVLLNSLFVLLGWGGLIWVLAILNVMLVAGYIVVLLWVEHSTARLVQQLEKTQQKTLPTINIAKKLGELLAIAEDAEVRSRLLKLKEAVDYGNNISTAATAETDVQMGLALDELANLLIARVDRLIILNQLEKAELTWKLRSNASSTIR